MRPTRDRGTQLRYLEAMGIQVWAPRHDAAPPPAPEPSHEVEPPRQAPQPTAEPPSTAEPTPPPPAVSGGTEVADLDWEGLRAAVAACQRCPLHTDRRNPVFGVGHPEADWLIVGEAPGAEEDKRGEPFVGRSGALLDRMLAAVGQSRETAFIANIIKSRPPNNRDPEDAEIAACMPYLLRQIELIRPRLILAVGRVAAQQLLATDQALGRLRGRVHSFGHAGIPLVVTYHPAYLLRKPSEKHRSWADLQLARATAASVV